MQLIVKQQFADLIHRVNIEWINAWLIIRNCVEIDKFAAPHKSIPGYYPRLLSLKITKKSTFNLYLISAILWEAISVKD